MNTRFFLLLFLCCISFGSYGQNQGGLPIKVLANEHTTTTIFFPSGIAKTIDPAANFKFEYQNNDPSIGLLQGRKGSPSNLTVITDNGYIYSFALRYSEKIESFNFMLSPDMAVGRTPNHKSRPVANVIASTEPTEIPSDDTASDTVLDPLIQGDDNPLNIHVPLIEDDEPYRESENGNFGIREAQGDLYHIDREEYYRIFCENNYLQKTIFRRTFRQSKRVVLKLNNILVDRNEIYFVLQVENNSRKEYNVNGLSFFRKTGLGQLQKIMKPLYVFNLQDKIDPQSINEVVFVFKRFTISNKEEVYVVLDELENDRMVMLPLDNKQINAPTN